jgi:hypothetical protein
MKNFLTISQAKVQALILQYPNLMLAYVFPEINFTLYSSLASFFEAK